MVTLAPDQYHLHDSCGCTIATRAVDSWPIFDAGAKGNEKGIYFHLRDGEKMGDGDSVGLNVTDVQLEELGYIRKEKIFDSVKKLFPKVVAREEFAGSTIFANRQSAKRVVLIALLQSLGASSDGLYADEKA